MPPTGRRRLGLRADGRFAPETFPWADERRPALIRAYLDALSKGDLLDIPAGSVTAVTAVTFLAPPDIQWDFLLDLLAASPDGDSVLGHIAAGPLEGLLGRFGAEVIERVEAEAGRSPKFRRALGGVWRHQMSDAVWARVRAIQTTAPPDGGLGRR